MVQQESKEPCKKEACYIQACLSKNNFLPEKKIPPRPNAWCGDDLPQGAKAYGTLNAIKCGKGK
ncbi:hypothetical protein C1H46_029940 [Malus baccata]|uniref:Uncharacterized protein n=1 Tax=Malus baccata TaxID=106549 RepID=A0A540LDF8_MALBA|nr:hypothetical protein C1H46_029940 [Malus baccata]